MTQKNQLFAFVAGEVSRAFYGRSDMAKYPLGLAFCENFFVDYHGGLLNRSGTEFLAALRPEPHRIVRYRVVGKDYVLLFLEGYFIPFSLGKPSVLPVEATVDILPDGTVDGATPGPEVERLVLLTYADRQTLVYGYFSPGTTDLLRVVSYVGEPVDGTSVQVQRTLHLSSSIPASRLERCRFSQDLNTLVITHDEMLPIRILLTDGGSWSIDSSQTPFPEGPDNVVVAITPATPAAASVAFAVTAVINGVESTAQAIVEIDSITNYSITTGHATVTWYVVPGAERYNIYRTLIYPDTFPSGAQMGYIGYTNGTSFVDMNTTPDFTKTLPSPVDFFADGNYPLNYTLFQQRGVYSGLKKRPLTAVSSMSQNKGLFGVSFPQLATDSYEYTLDAQSNYPIKHMLPLRYGLMLFTDEGVWQLKGGEESYALTAASAIAEHQGYVSVSDLSPIAINLDVLFMTSLFTEFNAMLYTEYTNSFKTQDIMVLSSHLFSAENGGIRVDWAAEPHKLLHFVREDGQRVSLTYERNQDVFGWSRYRTVGRYLDLVSIREDRYNICYTTVSRQVNGREVMFLERERPRLTSSYAKTWFVDCGKERGLIYPEGDSVLTRLDEDELGEWRFETNDLTWAGLDQRLYVADGLFAIAEIEPDHLILRAMIIPELSAQYDKNVLFVQEGDWGYNTLTNMVDGLWHLEGEKVSVQADGDAWPELLVENGQVTFPNEAARILVGLGYSARAKTLPLGLDGYILGGIPMTLRGVAVRQMDTRGLAVGRSFDSMEELPSRRYEAWGNPLQKFNELSVHDTFGDGSWDTTVQLCVETNFPLAASVLGLTFNIDVGED